MNQVILTAYYSYKKDPQRNVQWDLIGYNEGFIKLEASAKGFDIPLILFTEFDTTFKPNYELQPNVARWAVFNEWIERHGQSFDFIWMVDSTDVEVLSIPQPIEGKIYCGREEGMKVGCRWMRETQGRYLKLRDWSSVITRNRNHMLLNCGIVGGSSASMFSLTNTLRRYHDKWSIGLETSSDMSMFNYMMFKDRLIRAVDMKAPVCTKFKKYEYDRTKWFKHK